MPERKLTDMVQWADLPPALAVIRVPILSPKPTCSHRLMVVCDEHVTVATHYIRERTTACVGRDNGCEGCLAPVRKIWKTYLGVWWPETDRLWAAELTHRAVEMVAGDIDRNRGRLRGWVLLLSRPKPHKCARVYATLRPMTPEERKQRLPSAFNLRESLAQVWVNLRVGPPDERPDEAGGEVPE